MLNGFYPCTQELYTSTIFLVILYILGTKPSEHSFQDNHHSQQMATQHDLLSAFA